jgi:hypothetical protein
MDGTYDPGTAARWRVALSDSRYRNEAERPLLIITTRRNFHYHEARRHTARMRTGRGKVQTWQLTLCPKK